MVLNTVRNHDLVVKFTELMYLPCELPIPIIIKYYFFRNFILLKFFINFNFKILKLFL